MDEDSVSSRLLHVERAEADLRVEVFALKTGLHDTQVSIAEVKRDTGEIVQMLGGMKMLSRLLKFFIYIGGGTFIAWLVAKLGKFT